jgi:4'-phosphopantetheinyl transferase
MAPEIEGLPSAFFPDESYSKEDIYQRFFHGPIFQVMNGVEGVSADALLALGSVNHGPIGTGLITEPLVLEAAFQAAGLHHMITQDEMALPSRIAEVQLIRNCKADESLTITVNQFGSGYDVDVDGASGPVLRLRGFEMATLGPLPPENRFPQPDDARPVCLNRPLLSAPSSGATASASWEDDPTPWLSQGELILLTQRGTEQRQRDRIAGRIAAKRAVHALIGVHAQDIRIDNAESGEPIVHTQGGEPPVRVSITHRSGQAYATAVSQGRVGVDLERIETRSGAFEREWFSPSERALMHGQDREITIAWSAKEAVLKALGKGLAFSPRDIILTSLEPGAVTVELTGDVAREHAKLGGAPIHISWELEGSTQVLVHARFAAA